MNTRKYPRTLQEAFGPYTSSTISEPEGESRSEPRGFVAAVVCVGLVGLLIVWVTR